MPFYLEDLRSDFSAIHRVDEIERMAAPRFFALAYRIDAYPGVMQIRIRAEAAKGRPAAQSFPREMSAAQWLEAHPQAVAQVNTEREGVTAGAGRIQDR